MKMSSWRSGTYMSLVSHYFTKLMPSRPRLIPSEDQVLLSEAGTPSWCRGDISRRQPASHLHSLETTQLLEVATFFCKRYVEKHIWTQVICIIPYFGWIVTTSSPKMDRSSVAGMPPGMMPGFWCDQRLAQSSLWGWLKNGEKGENGTPSSQYLTQNFMIYMEYYLFACLFWDAVPRTRKQLVRCSYEYFSYSGLWSRTSCLAVSRNFLARAWGEVAEETKHFLTF